MKIGAHVEIIGKNLPYEMAFPVLHRLGAEGIELVFKEDGWLNIKTSDSAFIKAKKLAEDNGMSISSMTNGYSWSKPMTSNDPTVREIGDRALRRALEGAVLLGIDGIQVVPGYSVSSSRKLIKRSALFSS